ncbi:MAG: alpha-amylase family glycosyl hydrolase [Actinomycetaceae bacterium]|nr:alpha-amylase family glycosyl hydrolase [Actinomycetaceae bacterium]
MSFENAILWQVFPLGALGAPATNPEVEGKSHTPQRTLKDLTAWLDHAIRIGANGLLLGPIFHSYSHGYDTIDYRRIDPRLGTLEDFEALTQAAHERGIKVILDGVFNHVGSHHQLVQGLRGGPSEHSDYLLPNWEGWTEGELPSYHCFEGHTGLATLNHENPKVRAEITEVMNYWLEKGADGWRLDAAYAMAPGVWQDILPKVRERFPGAWIVGEVIQGDYKTLVEQAGWDSLTEYELWKATWSALNDANFYELDWTMQRHSELLGTFVPQTFIGNHDVTRIATRLENEEHVGIAVAVLMSVGGVPSIYYGDEVGFTGLKEERLGGDDAIRQELPASPDEALRDPRAQHFFHWYASLCAMRRNRPWLWGARTKTVHLENEVMRYVSYSGNSAITVVLNISDRPISRHDEVFAGCEHIAAGQFDNEALRPNSYIIFDGACGTDLSS